jgi:hypothetical protein
MRIALAAALAWVALHPAALRADNPPRENTRELHVVGLYEGATKTDGQIHGPRAVVTVDRPKKLVTLVLTSYSALTWEVQLAPGSALDKVILGGYERQAIKGIPETTEVVHGYRAGGNVQLGYCYRLDSANFRALVQQLSKLSELEVSSFQGSYRYAPETPIFVNDTQDDPRLLRNYPQPIPAAQVAKVEFKALRFAADPLRPFAQADWGDFTLSGSDDASFKPLPAGVKRLTFDPQGKRHYGIAGNDFVEVDPLQLTTKKLDPGPDLPRISRPADVTFDTRRKRLLVAGEYLYAFEPATGLWSVLAERPEAAAIAYHASLDRLFAISFRYAGDGHLPCLCEFNAHGALLKQSDLTGPLVPGSLGERIGFDQTPAQLVSAGDHLVLLISAQAGRGEVPVAPVAYCYLVDPATAKVRLTWKELQK